MKFGLSFCEKKIINCLRFFLTKETDTKNLQNFNSRILQICKNQVICHFFLAFRSILSFKNWSFLLNFTIKLGKVTGRSMEILLEGMLQSKICHQTRPVSARDICSVIGILNTWYFLSFWIENLKYNFALSKGIALYH